MQKKLLINLTENQVLELDILIRKRRYRNRSETIRAAIREFLEKKKLEEIEEKLQE